MMSYDGLIVCKERDLASCYLVSTKMVKREDRYSLVWYLIGIPHTALILFSI